MGSIAEIGHDAHCDGGVSRLGGIPSIAAVGVVIAGLQGSVLGLLTLKKLKVNMRRREDYHCAISMP